MHKGFGQAALTLWFVMLLIGGVALYFWPLLNYELVRWIPATAKGWPHTAAVGAVGLATFMLPMIVTDFIERRRKNPYQFLHGKAEEVRTRSLASFLVTLFTILFAAVMFVVLDGVAWLFLPLLETVYDHGRAEFAAKIGIIMTLVLLMGVVGNALRDRFVCDSRKNE